MSGRPYDDSPPERSGGRGEPDFWTPPDPTRDSFSAWSDGDTTTPLPQASTAPSQAVAPQQPPMWAYPYPAAAPPDRTGYAASPPSHLAWAVLGIFLGFWPLGVVATVRAASVGRLWAQERHDDARRASRSARRWAIGAFAVQAFLMVSMVLVPLLLFST